VSDDVPGGRKLVPDVLGSLPRHARRLLHRHADRRLLPGIQLAAAGRHIENVDRFVRLRVDQHHLDIPAVGTDGRRQIVQQAGAILRSSATISISVAVPLASESNTTRAAMPALRLGSTGFGRWRSSSFTSALPASTRSTVACRRSTSLGLRSSVRAGSAKVNVSSARLRLHQALTTVLGCWVSASLAPPLGKTTMFSGGRFAFRWRLSSYIRSSAFSSRLSASVASAG